MADGFWIGSLASICPACWMRSRMTAGQDGFRGASSTQCGGVLAPLDCTECLASRIDRSHHLLVLLQGPVLGVPPGIAPPGPPIWLRRRRRRAAAWRAVAHAVGQQLHV